MFTEKLKNLSYYKKAKAWYTKHEHLFLPGALLFGFIVDVITFKSLDIELSFIILAGHLLFAGCVILFMNVYDARWSSMQARIISYIRLFSPIALQFSFGALLSASFIFYSFAGVFSVSWPLLVVLLFLMLSNELFKKMYQRPLVQLTLYYFLLFMFFSLVLPFVFRSISSWLFLFSGILSLAGIIGYFYAFRAFIPDVAAQQRVFATRVAVIFVAMNVLYVFNVIPPVPLSVRDAGPFLDVKRSDHVYQVVAQKDSLLQKLIPGKKMYIQKGENIYVFTSIFAPSELHTRIVHHWQMFDEQDDAWRSTSKLAYGISGGRKDGYRGYTLRPITESGKYRVLVETERGQVMGKVSFRVSVDEKMPEKVTLTK